LIGSSDHRIIDQKDHRKETKTNGDEGRSSLTSSKCRFDVSGVTVCRLARARAAASKQRDTFEDSIIHSNDFSSFIFTISSIDHPVAACSHHHVDSERYGK
jgi:hypothetical protein